jgi:hypothetical protein
MNKLVLGVLFALGGYFVCAIGGYFLVEMFSSNTHDVSVEAAMTSAFVFGPVGAIVAFIFGLRRGRERSSHLDT